MYMGSDGVYTHTVPYERDSNCLMCGAGLPLPAADDMTLEQVHPLMHDSVMQQSLSALTSLQICTYLWRIIP